MRIGNGRAVANGHSQTDILRFVGALNRFEKKIKRFINGPSDAAWSSPKPFRTWLRT